LFYWRERGQEVDFVLRSGRKLIGIEVKSSRARGAQIGLGSFAEAYSPEKILLVGGDGIPVGEFLSEPVETWLIA
jgi:predicted AAA+ superfamily ATPase